MNDNSICGINNIVLFRKPDGTQICFYHELQLQLTQSAGCILDLVLNHHAFFSLRTKLEALGFKVERHPVPDDVARANGMISATNLVVRECFGDGPVIACNAHGDVVPPGLGWSVDPYGAQIKDGYMYGRGVAVSKSDFATYAFALLALNASGVKLNGTVELHPVKESVIPRP